MKKNNIIIASAISALPFIVWGVKAVIKKDPLQKIKDTLIKQDLYMKDDMKKAGIHTSEENETNDIKITEETPDIETHRKTKTSSKTGSINAKTAVKDKIVAKTNDGQNIYEGAKGGRYTISASGKKFYVKK